MLFFNVLSIKDVIMDSIKILNYNTAVFTTDNNKKCIIAEDAENSVLPSQK